MIRGMVSVIELVLNNLEEFFIVLYTIIITWDNKLIWSIVGLLCDFFGAWMLAIPLLWNDGNDVNIRLKKIRNTATRLTENFLSRAAHIPVKLNINGDQFGRFQWFLLGINLFSIFLVSLPFIVSKNYILWAGQEEQSQLSNNILLNESFLTIVATVGVSNLIAFVPAFFWYLFSWISNERKHQKRIGIIGLCILCTGFMIQAVINIQFT